MSRLSNEIVADCSKVMLVTSARTFYLQGLATSDNLFARQHAFVDTQQLHDGSTILFVELSRCKNVVTLVCRIVRRLHVRAKTLRNVGSRQVSFFYFSIARFGIVACGTIFLRKKYNFLQFCLFLFNRLPKWGNLCIINIYIILLARDEAATMST